MFKEPENGYFALVLSIIVFGGIVAFVSWSVPYSKGYQAADSDHQSAYADNQAAQESRQKCAALASTKEAIQCYDEYVTTDRDHHRAEQDLDAQREMANWAEGMLWATLFVGGATIFITALGAFWVKRTLDQTKEAVRVADDAVVVSREIGQAQARAYISITDPKLIDFEIGKKPKIGLPFKNTGQTPAKRLEVIYNLEAISPTSAPKIYFERRFKSSSSDVGAGAEKPMSVDGADIISQDVWENFINQKIVFRASGIIRYFDVFGKRHFTVFCYVVLAKRRDFIIVTPAHHHNTSS